jgi:hypothetical protein
MKTVVALALMVGLASIFTFVCADMYAREIGNIFEYVERHILSAS